MDFYINIEDAAGNRLGDGPITSADGWRYTARMDRAGEFSFNMPASDPKASLIQRKRIARAFALLDSTWTEVGAGIIDKIDRTPGADGITKLTVTGPDLLGELAYRTVKDLKIYLDNAPISHSAAVGALATFAPAGWTFTPDPAPGHNSLYLRFNGNTVLNGLVKIADASQNHFYGNAGRNLVFASTFTSSGVRAIRATGDLAAETCAITAIREQIDVADLITRIYPRGSGNGDVQLTLKATTRAAPTGFVLDKSENYIEHTASTASYGRIERQIDFRDIGPVENTTADIQAAANMLFDAALEELKRRSNELEQATYTLQLAQCSQLLRPMQSIVVDYNDPDTETRINATLNILEATWTVDAQGIRTTDLVVSNADRWPASDTEILAGIVEQGQAYQVLPQLNANSYTTSYKFPLDSEETGEVSFWFGREVVQLQQVLFRFRLLPLESTVKAVGGVSGAAGALPTSGPSIDSTNTAGVTTTGTGGPTATDTGGPTATGGATGETGSSGAGNTGGSSPATGSTAPNTGGSSPATGSSGAGDTGNNSAITIGLVGNLQAGLGGPTATGTGGPTETGGAAPDTGGTSLTTGSPSGGDTISAGRHLHGMPVLPRASESALVYFHPDGQDSFFVADGASGNVPVNTSGDHTHAITSHTHTIASHTHTTATHTHTIDTHTHTISEHTHGITAHTHTTASHTHTTASHTHTTSTHTHTTASHTHTTATHTHTVGSHTHTVATHTHTIAQHTHSLSQHTHSLSNHAHDLSEAISAVYGIFREDASRTYGLSELEYRVNGGSWLDLSTAADEGGGWRAIDITDAVMDADNLRPLQAANTLEIRAEVTGDPIDVIVASGSFVLVTPASGFDAGNVGQVMQITGTVGYNGFYVISSTSGGDSYVAAGPFGPTDSENTGTVRILRTVTIDGLLSVRNIVQATAVI